MRKTHMRHKCTTLRIMALNIPDEAANVSRRLDGGEVGGERVSTVGRRPVVLCNNGETCATSRNQLELDRQRAKA